jgi:hypothetical protein
MKALWTKFAIPVCTPPAISERNTQRPAHRKEEESETINGNAIRRSESGNRQRNETVH